MIFDGHDLNSLFVVGRPSVETFANREFQDVPGRDGTIYMGGSLTGGNISVKLSVVRMTKEQRRGALSTLFQWLDVDEPKLLALDDRPGISYKAIPSGEMAIESYSNADSVTVDFRLVEPAGYGDQHSVVVPSGGSISFTVGGNYQTMPTILAASAVRSSSSLVWGIRLDNGSYIHVATGTSAARRIEADCENRTCYMTANRTVKLPTIDSDWFVLTPGNHVIANDQGSGDCRVTWTERWL